MNGLVAMVFAALAAGGFSVALARARASRRDAAALAARVARLEAELAAAGAAAAEPQGASGAGGAAVEDALILDQAQRLTESSFVAGSDALVRVRTALKSLKDCRLRLNASEKGEAPGGAVRGSDGTAAGMAAVFAALSSETTRLAACARGLRPLAETAEAMAGLTRPTPAAPRTVPGWNPARPSAAPVEQLLLAALRLRSLAAELEVGLGRMGAELRLLGRLPAKPAEDGETRARSRNGPDPALSRALARLETQLSEVAADIGVFTRDAEHLSRELGRLRQAVNGRPVA